MGIYKFYSEYVLSLPKFVRPKKISELNKQFDALLIDANGILHPIAQEVFGYADFAKQPPRGYTTIDQYMAKYRELLREKIFDLIGSAGNPPVVVIVVDGVAPAAKITQQRSRRYGAVSEQTHEIAGGLFDSAVIVPGTDFMMEVDGFFREIIDELSPTTRVFYSSHLEQGEGEHKMFWIAKREFKANANIVVDGLDSDLFMISLTAKFSVTLLRPDSFFEINTLKRYLEEIFDARRRKLSKENVYNDFIVILYLIGNDFLPRLDLVTNVREIVDLMVEIHKSLGRKTITNNGTIGVGMLFQFLERLAAHEETLLGKKSLDESSYYYPHKILHHPDVVSLVNRRDYIRAVSDKLYKDSDAMKIANSYIDGILWVFNYYTQQTGWSKRWTYQYNIAPLARHLAMASRDYNPARSTWHNQDTFLTINQQLVSVIPPQVAAKFLPKELAKWILPGGKLEDIAPWHVEFVFSGIKREKDAFMRKVLVPKLDPARVCSLVE